MKYCHLVLLRISLLSVSKDSNKVQSPDSHIVLGGEEEHKTIQGQLLEREVEEEVTMISFSPLLPPKMLPFPDQAPKAIMDRWHFIGTYTAGSTALYSSFNPIFELLQWESIQEALHTFVYLRSDVEVMFYMTSVPTQYGQITIINNPGGSVTGGSATGTPADVLPLIMSHDPIVMDVSVQNQTHVVFPWMSPAPYLKIDDLRAETVIPTLFSIHNTIIYDLSNPSAPQPVRIALYARFKNPMLTGFAPIAASRKEQRTYVEAQMMNFIFEAATAHALGEVAEPYVSSAASSAAGYIDDKLGVKEAFCSYDTLKGMTGDFCKKPTLPMQPKVADEPVKQSVYGDLVSNTSVPRLSSTALLSIPNVSIRDVIRRPSLVSSGSLGTTTSFVDIIRVHPSLILGTTNYMPRLTFYSRFFRYWRGSITFVFRFIASPLMSYKAAIALAFAGTGFTSSDLVNLTDQVARIVTVRGTTQVSINMPYCHTAAWQLCSISETPLDTRNYVYLTINQAPVAAATSATIVMPYQVWAFAGPDFEFAGLRDVNPLKDPGVEVEAQSQLFKLAHEHESTFFQGMTLPDKVDMTDCYFVEDLARRFCALTFDNSTSLQPYNWVAETWDTTPTQEPVPNMMLIARSFLFSRGEIDYKMTFDSDSTATFQGVESTPTEAIAATGTDLGFRISDGTVALNPSFGNVLSFSSSFFSGYDVVQHNSRGSQLVDSNNFPWTDGPGYGRQYGMPLLSLFTDAMTMSTTRNFAKLGAGFGFFYELPPPNAIYVPVAGNYTLPLKVKGKQPNDSLTHRSPSRDAMKSNSTTSDATSSLSETLN